MYDAQWEAELIARVEAALPIDDLVGWLLREYPGSSEQDVLTMVHKVYDRDYKIAPSSPELRSFEVGNNTWQACPQRVERA